ncbi:glycosyltransferase [Arabiibacter massiliensis]|uniref:glycosyltransferase n=1 Tax=Arabiibacter massiliensis TaxID=1870985 RepID=UPI0009BBEB35|nr:glycosyltransferase [Arabiibacter massiliensis]
MGKMNSGGKKTLAMQYFLNFNPAEVEVHFICDADSNAIPEDEIRRHGGFVHMVPPYQNIVKNMVDMRELFARERFDVLHAYNSTMNLFPLRAAKQAGISVRISESLSMAHEREPKTYLKHILRKFAKRYATHYVSCGEDCGRWQFGDALFDAGYVDVFKTAIDSAKNSFDEGLRARTRAELGAADDELLVGFVGRFVVQKNPMFMLETAKELVDLNSKVRLLLIGDGELRDEMLAYVDANGFSDHVLYLGRREDIVGFYQAMDCLLLPSLYEGLPVVGLEAQCAGLDVFFSTEVTPEAAFCELGHFLSLADGAKKWAEKISVVLENHRNRTSRSKDCVNAGFDSRGEAKRLAVYYANALARQGSC